MNERLYHLAKVVQKIPLFEGLGQDDVQSLLRVGVLKSYEAEEVIYSKGDPSDEMLVLLRGKLSVTAESGAELAELRPGTPIGEMGVFTGEPRSANIVAVQSSTGIVIGRDEISVLLGTHTDIHLAVSKNLVRILSQRLMDANELNEATSRMNRDLQKLVDKLERELLEAKAEPAATGGRREFF